jgi:hypothetical protein
MASTSLPKKKSNPTRNILFAAIIIIVGVVIYSRYAGHKRYDHISRLDYVANDSIDYNYYNQQVLSQYLVQCQRLTSIAKSLWLRNGIDIHLDTAAYGEAQSQIYLYRSTLRYTLSLENRLKESTDLKQQGMSNEQIEKIQANGYTIGALQADNDKHAAFELLKGKNIGAGAKPNEIWELQKLLNQNDYKIIIDGIYSLSTDSALSDFQRTYNIYPSHTCDDLTLSKLVE